MIIIGRSKDELFEMANLDKESSGLPVNIWIDTIGHDRLIKHNIPRLKMQNNYNERVSSSKEMIPVSISTDPKILLKRFKLNIRERDLNKVYDFIKNNYNILMDHWNKKLTDKQALNMLSVK